MSVRGGRKLSKMSEIQKCLNLIQGGGDMIQISLKFKKNGHTVALVRASPKLTNYRQKTEVFHQRSSSIKGFLLSKVVFLLRWLKYHLAAPYVL